jgi:hypothetical protein
MGVSALQAGCALRDGAIGVVDAARGDFVDAGFVLGVPNLPAVAADRIDPTAANEDLAAANAEIANGMYRHCRLTSQFWAIKSQARQFRTIFRHDSAGGVPRRLAHRSVPGSRSGEAIGRQAARTARPSRKGDGARSVAHGVSCEGVHRGDQTGGRGLAATARRRVLDMVSTDRIPVAGVHLDFPGYGRVTAGANGRYIYLHGRALDACHRRLNGPS